MIRVSHTAPTGHVMTDPAFPNRATAHLGDVRKEFNGVTCGTDALNWLSHAEARAARSIRWQEALKRALVTINDGRGF